MNEAIRMQLSAFADGELPENEKELLLRRLSQDGEMRRQVAEYLAIGRAIRGEMQVRGIDTLRDRIAEDIGAIAPEELEDVGPAEAADDVRESGLTRPVVGFAVAAAVALVAVLGLRQMAGVEEVPADIGVPLAADTTFPTQPEVDKVLEQYRVLHDVQAATSYLRTHSVELRVLAEERDEAAGVDSEGEDDAESRQTPAASGSSEE